jgi:O-succinylbenzoic acid--CoA ligase
LARALTQPQTTKALAALDAVLVGGSAVDESLRRRAEQSKITVVASYGMTETCGGCVYDGRPLSGVIIDLEPDTNRILITSAMAFSSYRLRPDLTNQALRGSTVLTQDRGEWAAGQLRVKGRLDDEVTSGGINVDLAELERACRSWPGLAGADLAIVGVPDANWGSTIIAVTDGNGSLQDLRRFLSQTLPGHAAPRQLVHLDRLPRTGSGKIDRPEIAERVARQVLAGGRR